ncbi:MAG: PAS domain S-box protein [Candidatus Omnitrophica bacterium]|nr:PAS domain S-box protein [Candidatus Omnitrophota bacterium]
MFEVWFNLADYGWNPYAIPPFVVGLVSFALGAAVCVREKGSKISLLFFLMTTTTAIWLLGYSVVFCAINEITATRWAVLTNSAVTFLPTTVYVFTLAAVGRSSQYRITALLSLLTSIAFCAALIFTHSFMTGLYHYSWGYYSRFGWVSALFLVFFFGILLESLRLFLGEYKRLIHSTKKQRMKRLLVAFCIGYLGSMDYLAAYGIPVYPAGYLPVFAFLMMVGRAIAVYRLIDITPSFAAEQIIKTMADALLVIDRSGVVRVANQAALDLFQHNEIKLIGGNIMITGIDLFKKDRLARLIVTDSVQNNEITYQHPNKGKLILEISTSVIRDAKAHGLAVVFIAKDVTARKKADQALRESEIHYRLLAENVSDVIWTMNTDLKFTYMSPSIERLTGYKVEEAMALSLEKTIAAGSLKEVLNAIAQEFAPENRKAASKFQSRTIQLEYLCKKGNMVWTEVQITFLRREDGRVMEILGVTRDITERRKAEEAVRESERCYAELVQQAPDPIITLDRLGYLQSMNPAAELALGYGSPELIGKHFAKTGVVGPDSVAKTLQEFTLTILGWQRPPFELQVIRKDSIVLTMEAHPKLIRRDKESFRVQVIFRDITERKRIEQELLSA